MYTLTKWIAAPVLAFGLMAVSDTKQAEAQSLVIGGGGVSVQFGTPYRYPSYYGATRLRYGYPVGVPGVQYRYRYGLYDCPPPRVYRYRSPYLYPGVPGYPVHPYYHRFDRRRH